MKKVCIITLLVFAVNALAASAGIAGGGRITKTNNSYAIQYFITDHLGSTRSIVNDNGNITAQYNYYPFGRQWEDAGLMANTNRYRFNGKEEQTTGQTNWLDYGARMYDSETGRWFTQDPLAEMYYSVSQYAYCMNNPVNYIDPYGMAIEETDDSWTITGDDIFTFWDYLMEILDGSGAGGSSDGAGGMIYPYFGGTEHIGAGAGSTIMNAFFAHQAFYGGILPAAVCTASAPDWMMATEPFDKRGTQVMEPLSGFWEHASYFLFGRTYSNCSTTYDVDSEGKIKGITPITGTPPIPGFGKGVSIIKTGTSIIKTGTKAVKGGKSINQLKKLVEKGKAPKSINRFEKGGVYKGEKPHVHFNNVSALNIDGTWKEGFKILTNAEKEFLKNNGCIIP